MEAEYTPVSGEDHEAILNDGGILTLTPPAGAVGLMLQVEGGDYRVTLSGTEPDWESSPPLGFRIRTGAWPAILPVGANTTVKILGGALGSILQYQWVE